MAYEIREIEETTYLVDTIRESILEKSLDETEKLLQEYPRLLREYGYQINKENLVGVSTRGIQYFKDIEAKKIEDFAKNSPLARASIERMKAERIAEVIPNDFGDKINSIYDDIAETWRDNGLGGLSEEDFIYKEKEISLDRRNISRKKLDLYTTKLTETQLEVISKSSLLLKDILSLEEKGVIVLNTNWGRKGLLANFGDILNTASTREQISEGLLASMVLNNFDGRTREERLSYVPGKEYSDYTKPEPQIVTAIPQVFGSYSMDEGKGYGSATIDKD